MTPFDYTGTNSYVNKAKSYNNWMSNKDNINATWDRVIKGKNIPIVPSFDFLGVNMKNIPASQKAKTYTTGLINFSKAHIELVNTDKDKNTLSFDEFLAYKKELAQNAGEEISANDVKSGFKNIDIDGNNLIDEKELATTFAFMDVGIEGEENEGMMDGKISHQSTIFTNFANDKIKPRLTEYYKFLFE